MIDKGTVDSHQSQAFDMALGEKQSVEGVAGRRFRIESVENVGDFDPEYLQAN